MRWGERSPSLKGNGSGLGGSLRPTRAGAGLLLGGRSVLTLSSPSSLVAVPASRSQGHTLCAKQTCGVFPIVFLARSVAVHLCEMQSDSNGVKVILHPGGHFTLPAWAGGSCLQ